MSRTGSHLKIKRYGDNAMGVELEGNPNKPEPIHFRVSFPGGDVDIVRTTDGDYWAHVAVNRRGHSGFDPESVPGLLRDGRIDCVGEHARSMPELERPEIYHAAFRVKRDS